MLDINQIIDYKTQFEDVWLNYEDVYAVGVGHKLVGGEATDIIAIRIYTTKKKALANVPEAQRFPKELDGIPVDVIEGVQPVALNELSGVTNGDSMDPNMYRPMSGGIQISRLKIIKGEYFVSNGTLGMFVRYKQDPSAYYALSNWHVLGELDADIYQPKYTGTRSSKLLCATVKKGDFYESADCGIAKVLFPDSEVRSNYILDIGRIRGIQTERAQLDQIMRKRGRTTGVTVGKVIDVDFTAYVTKDLKYTHQVLIHGIEEKEIANHGDSGSVFVTYDKEVEANNNYVAGLFWGGDEVNNNAVYSPIKYVFDYLDIELCKDE